MNIRLTWACFIMTAIMHLAAETCSSAGNRTYKPMMEYHPETVKTKKYILNWQRFNYIYLRYW